MTGTEILVVAAAIAAIVWVNWYFLFAKRSSAAAHQEGGVQRVEIAVRGGYDPGEVRLQRGVPAQLVFDRQETSSCSEEVVIPAFGIRRALPAFKKTTIELTPNVSGRFEITCGMSMLHGTLVVGD
jgi:plastocyanin domain-containing protein